MPNQTTKRFVGALAGLALLLIVSAWIHGAFSQQLLFTTFAACALFASARKVRIPGLEGNFSLNFIVLLAAARRLPLIELQLVAAACAVLQSYWRPLRQPQWIQTVFNSANMVVSISAAKWAMESAAVFTNTWHFLNVGVAAAIYYLVNTGLTATVLVLVTEGGFRDIWHRWSFHALPHFLLGSVIVSAWILLPADKALQNFLLLGLLLAAMGWVLRRAVREEIPRPT